MSTAVDQDKIERINNRINRQYQGGFGDVFRKIFDLTFDWSQEIKSVTTSAQLPSPSFIADPADVGLFIDTKLAEFKAADGKFFDGSITSSTDVGDLTAEQYYTFPTGQPTTKKAAELLSYSVVALLLAVGLKLTTRCRQAIDTASKISSPQVSSCREYSYISVEMIEDEEGSPFFFRFYSEPLESTNAYFEISVYGCKELTNNLDLLEQFLTFGPDRITKIPFEVCYEGKWNTNNFESGCRTVTLQDVYSKLCNNLGI